jgi:hypothetical protein
MTKDILNASRFADVSFVPHGYKGAISLSGDSTIQVTGTFTLHGTPHELTVPMQIHIVGKNCTAKTRLAVPYVKWGLKVQVLSFLVPPRRWTSTSYLSEPCRVRIRRRLKSSRWCEETRPKRGLDPTAPPKYPDRSVIIEVD